MSDQDFHLVESKVYYQVIGSFHPKEINNISNNNISLLQEIE